MKTRRYLCLLLALVMICCSVPLGIFADDGFTNIALGKTITASSSYNTLYTPDKMVDGDDTSDPGRWNSARTQGKEWVLLDLGAVCPIRSVKLTWLAWGNVAGKISLSISSDGDSYQTIESIEGNVQVAENEFTFDTVNARYVKLDLDQCASDWGYSIKELTVIGKEMGELPPQYENLAMGTTVTASSSYNELYTPDKAVDGNYSADACRWNSQGTRGEEWLLIDLEREYDVFKLSMRNWLDVNLATELTVLTSRDGKEFTELYKTTDNTAMTTVIEPDQPVKMRYVKFIFNGCKSDWGYSISEVEVFSKAYLKQENIAIGKDVYVNEIFNDSWQYDIEAYYLTDGKTETRWSSATQVHNPPATPVEAWVMLDMEQVCSLRRLILRWNDIVVYAKDFTVLVSDDGVEFTKVMDVTTDTYVPVQMVNLSENTAGRYVRLEFHVPSNIYGYSLQEVEVYGEATEEKGEELDVSEAEYALYTGSVILSSDENASGGICVTNINYRDTCIFDDLPESHNMVVHYRCSLGGRLTVYIDDRYATDVALPATEGDGFGELSIDMYIPKGSTVTVVPSRTMDLDRIDWNSSARNEKPDELLFANDGSSSSTTVVNQVPGSYDGGCAQTKKGAVITYRSLPVGDYNTVALKYMAKKATSVKLKSANGETKTFRLPESDAFNVVYLRMDQTVGDTFALTVDGVLTIDTLTLMDTARSEVVDVSFNGGLRETVLLDGTWDCTVGEYGDTEIPELFDKTIPVPGMWDLADSYLGSDGGKSLWYRKTINLTEKIPAGQRVILRINKAYYGRTVYVNGEQVGKYYYNFTASEMDITDYMKIGENTIHVKLGTYESGKQDSDNPAHMGYDLEKTSYLPGIVDSVSLILNRDPYVDTVQTAPDLDSGELRVVTQIKNDSSKAITGSVVLKIYELGVYTDGVPAMEKLINTVTLENQKVAAGSALKIDEVVEIPDFDKESKAWRPGNPYLYRLVIETAGDSVEHRFGMRTFVFDEASGKTLLNGNEYYLRGTNVLINRFYEDVKREDHPWDEEWVKQLFAEFQAVNWEGARFCIGFPPEFWYDLCDEIGFMVVDEYPYWYCSTGSLHDGCKVEDLTKEYVTWIYERNNHPCVIFWDAQNESNGEYDLPLTAQVIQNVRDIDIQNRGWDNGWGPVQDSGFPSEHHNYPFINHDFTLDGIGLDSFLTIQNPGTKFNYTNEYGWIWVDRNGNPTLHTHVGYKNGNRGSSPEDYKHFYAVAVAQMTERWRSRRDYFGIFQFCGLTYSFDDGTGYTSDVLCPDLTTPIIREEQRERMRSAFAPVGIVINDWSTSGKGGTTRSVPVILVNDLNEDITKTVTVTLYKNHKEAELEKITSVTKTISAKAMEVTKATEFLLDMPADGGDYTIVASYEVEGENPICSTRYVVLSKGEDAETPLETDEKPPVSEDQPLPPADDPSVGDQPTENDPTVQQPATNEPADESGSMGLWIGIAVAGLAAVAAVIAVIVIRRKK